MYLIITKQHVNDYPIVFALAKSSLFYLSTLSPTLKLKNDTSADVNDLHATTHLTIIIMPVANGNITKL